MSEDRQPSRNRWSSTNRLQSQNRQSSRIRPPPPVRQRQSRATRFSIDDWGINDVILDILNSAEPALAPDGTLQNSRYGGNAQEAYERLNTPLEDQRYSARPSTFSSFGYQSTDNLTKWHSNETLDLPPLERPPLAGEKPKVDDTEYPGPLRLACLITGICLAVLLISLDRTIITTAIPFIAKEFKSYSDIGWYGSAYLLTACSFQPLYGRVFTLFSIKWSFLLAVGLFEVGSFICGIAPNSITLIVGRAIAGLGSAGILTGSFVVVTHAVPTHKRPVYTAAVGLMFGVGATAGPLLGGVFTDLSTWRWCFYINLPIGGVTMIAMVFFFNPRRNNHSRTFVSRCMELDFVGNGILLGTFVMLFLAFEYTEEQVSWSSPKVIGLLAGCGVTILIFITWLWYRGEKALIPLHIVKQRSVAASCCMAFFTYSALLIHSYYLPIWFQAIKDATAIMSGVDMIAYVAANAIFSMMSGIFVFKIGYFTPPSMLGTAIATVGCGLMTLLKVDTPTGRWIGFEILTSAGFGMAIQQGFTAVQTVLPIHQVPIGTAAVVACQSLGGAIFVSVGNTIYQGQLFAAASSGQLPGVDIEAVIIAEASGFRSVVQPEALPGLLVVYNSALCKVFLAAVPVAGLAFFSSLFLEWRSVKPKPKAPSNNEVTEA